MKTSTLWIFALLLACGSLTAQKVVVNSPESLAGAYTFGTASFGAVLTDSIWTGDLAIVNDGTSTPTSRGCTTLTNTEELMGKIAVIDRGACEFGLKALNAQMAGAIGAIILNINAGEGPIPMGGGAVGSQVSLDFPVVMLSLEDGQKIKAALQEGATINVSIGNIVFENDISLSADNALGAPYGAYPISQLREAGDYIFVPGVTVVNTGTSDAENIEATATIDHVAPSGDTTTVYAETVSVTASLQPDSLAGVVSFPPFDPLATGLGRYLVSYSITSDNSDAFLFDNDAGTYFDITEDIYSRATINQATGKPNFATSYTVGGGGAVEFISLFPFPHGEGYQIDSVFFRVTKSTALASELIDALIYKWDDANDDVIIQNAEITVVGFAQQIFDSETTATTAAVTLPVLDFSTLEEGPIVLEDGSVYGLGVRYSGENTVFISFDQNIHFWSPATAAQVVGTYDSDLDLPYILTTTFIDFLPDIENSGSYFTNVGSVVSSAFIISSTETGVNDLAGTDAFEMNMFPNPTSDQLQVDVELKESSDYIVYRVLNMQGQVVTQSRKTLSAATDRFTLDASQLAVGQYVLIVATEQGMQAKHFTVSR